MHHKKCSNNILPKYLSSSLYVFWSPGTAPGLRNNSLADVPTTFITVYYYLPALNRCGKLRGGLELTTNASVLRNRI